MVPTAKNLVSVVMPCYNGMPYLPQALESAAAQTHSPHEIIIVDDGSSDESAAHVHQYIAQHPNHGVTLIEQPNAGEPSARNKGIEQATGDWVAMLDTDDWWEPQKLEKQLHASKDASCGGSPDCVLVHTGIVRHFPNGRAEPEDLRPSQRRTGHCTAALLEPAHIGHPSILVRRDALTEIGGYDPSFIQACDIDLYLRLSAVGTFAFVPEHLLHYRYHEGQMSTAKFKQLTYHFRAIEKFCREHPEQAQEIGDAAIRQSKIDLVEVKLESYYWRRLLHDFRQLLAYAEQQALDSPTIRNWQRKARWPNWLILLKDKLAAPTRQGAA